MKNFASIIFMISTICFGGVDGIALRNILGLYRNPQTHNGAPPGPGHFSFLGYDLIEEMTQVSALTNCGGFPDLFANTELNQYGLIPSFPRASEIRSRLRTHHPDEPHANCEMYAIWRMLEN